jgi:hypothetical protein
MKLVNQTVSGLLMLGGDIVSGLCVAAVMAIISVKLHQALYAFSILLVIPIGALITGWVAGLGHVVAFRKYPYRPNSWIIPGVMAISVATYFAIQYMDYSLLEVKGRHISTLISFGRYLDIAIRNTTLELVEAGTVGRMGLFGYFVMARDIAGFAIGSFVSCYTILSEPFCTSCERRLHIGKTAIANTRTMSSLQEAYRPARELLGKTNIEGAVQWIVAEGAKVKSSDSVFRLKLRLMDCTRCRLLYYDLTAARTRPPKEMTAFHLFSGYQPK